MRWVRPLLLVLLLVPAVTVSDGGGPIVVLKVDQAIGPAISDYVHRSLERAANQGTSLVVMQLNTPGGLDESMREIVRDVIASAVPVVVYVAPAGARAASAGTYITYAAHLAAMAPATNLGAATPVQLGGIPDFTPAEKSREKAATGKRRDKDPPDEDAVKDDPTDAMSRKLINDAVAYIRSLAQLRGRNAEWAEKAVREGASLSAEDALAQGVIDVIAPDLDALLTAIHGREVKLQLRTYRLSTQERVIEIVEPDWRSRLLAVITNPNIAYILLLLGFYGLIFELSNPGFVLPGVIGAISLLLALYALNVLPVNYAGLALILIGVAFMAGEVFMPSFGALGIGGVIAFVIGSVILFDAGGGGYTVSTPLIAGLALLSAGFFMGVAVIAMRLHRRKAVTGVEALIGSLGEALEDFEDGGRVRTHGETWRASAPAALKRGQRVRVIAVDGLTLIVEAVPEEN